MKNFNKFQNTPKKERGITLIALVITIVILIILATVAINAVFKDGGLIDQAELAKDLYNNSAKDEETAMSNLAQQLNGLWSEEGGSGPEEPTLPDGWDPDKVKPEESGDGVTVPVPIGYTASDATNENTVNGGFVIYEGEEAVTDSNVAEAKTSRNQFVWVPVDDVTKIANTAKDGGTDGNGRTNYQGKLYDFSTSGATERTSYGQGTTSYREPDVVTGSSGSSYDNAQEYVKTILGLADANALKTQLQEEFNEMIASVDTYGGFYIGRYETGNLASNTTTEPVVVKGNNSISSVNWYYMYQNSKKIAANGNVVSTMIWGSMFDRTLIWLTETGSKTYQDLEDSISWGNYSNSTGEAQTNSGDKQSTGKNEAWKANNIYDLAGNVRDWTIEANYADDRVARGRLLHLFRFCQSSFSSRLQLSVHC